MIKTFYLISVLCLICFYTAAQKNEVSQKPLKLKGEREIRRFFYDGRLHVVTMPKKGSVLNVHREQVKGGFSKSTQDFGRLPFALENPTSMYEAFKRNAFYSVDIGSQSIQTVYAQNKTYYIGDKFYMTFDLDSDGTIIVDYDSETDKFSYNKVFAMVVEKKKHGRFSSNSFISENKLFQFSSSKTEFGIKITNLNDKSVIKELSLTSDNATSILKRATKDKSYKSDRSGGSHRTRKNVNNDISTAAPLFKKSGKVDYLSPEEVKILFKEIPKRRAAIYVDQLEGITMVTIGSYHEKNANSFLDAPGYLDTGTVQKQTIELEFDLDHQFNFIYSGE